MANPAADDFPYIAHREKEIKAERERAIVGSKPTESDAAKPTAPAVGGFITPSGEAWDPYCG